MADASGLEHIQHIVLHGADDYQLEAALHRLRKKVVDPNFAALGHKIIRKPSLADITEALSAVAFSLGGRTVVEFHEPDVLVKNLKDGNEKAIEQIKEVIQNPPGNTLFVWVATKMDGRLAFPKWLLAQKAMVQAYKFEPFKFWQLDQVEQFLWHEAERQHILIEPTAISALVSLWGTDLRVLVNEIQKLATYADAYHAADKSSKAITVSDVEALSHHHENLFRMIDNWMLARVTAADVEALKKSLLSQHPVAIFAMIQGYFNNLFRVAWVHQRYRLPADAVAERLGQKLFTVKKNIEATNRMPLKRLVKLKRQLLDYEWQTKTGQLDGVVALEMLLVS